MKNAGLVFEGLASAVDERALETSFTGSGATPQDLALFLAQAKAADVSKSHPQALVLGADQTLSLGDIVLHKAQNLREATERLLDLSGKTHQLNSAMTLARDGQIIWRHVSVARLTMRKLSPAFVARHLAATGDAILGSVGCYQLEGIGLQLFDTIEGDYFTIVGLPMLPLLQQLRQMGELDG